MGIKTIFLAYREWALEVYPAVASHPNVASSVLCKTDRELRSLEIGAFDLLVSCGWSEELGAEITSNIQAIGVHCAELDRYSYGTPLQLQIIDGVRYSKHRIFEFTVLKARARTHSFPAVLARGYPGPVWRHGTGSVSDDFHEHYFVQYVPG